MYSECKKYLMETLKKAGIKTPVLTSLKKLKANQDSHVGAVLFGDEVLLRNGSKRTYENGGIRKKRRTVFDRNLTFSVFIGDYSEDKVESIYEQFISNLDAGIMYQGNYIRIEPEAAEWIDEDDNILKSKVAVQLKVTFYGGVYKESAYTPVGFKIEVKKEDNHG